MIDTNSERETTSTVVEVVVVVVVAVTVVVVAVVAVAVVAAGYGGGDNHRGVQIDGAVTSRGAGCCVAMVTANGPGRPLREYIRPSATSELEILLNFICAVPSRFLALCLAHSLFLILSLSLSRKRESLPLGRSLSALSRLPVLADYRLAEARLSRGEPFATKKQTRMRKNVTKRQRDDKIRGAKRMYRVLPV